MDTKRTYIFMLLAMVLLFGWQAFQSYELAHHPEWKRTDNSNPPAAAGPATPPLSNAAGIGPVPTTQAAIKVIGAASASESVLGREGFADKQFVMGLSLTGKGGGVESVELNQFRAEADSTDQDLFRFQHPYSGEVRPLGVHAVSVDGQRIELWNEEWRTTGPATTADGMSQEFDVDLALNQTPVVTISETFTLPRVDQKKPDDGGYEVRAVYGVKSLSDQPHTVKLEVNGPIVPRASTRRDIPSVLEGYNDSGSVVLNYDTPSSLSTAGATKDLTASSKGFGLLWYGTASNYFCAIARPDTPSQFVQTSAIGLGLDPETQDPMVALRATTTDITIPAGGQAAIALTDFFGPKQRQLLNNPYYTTFPLAYDSTLVMTVGWCALCVMPKFVSALFWMLWAFHFVLRDWGLAIIALVCLVRLILHPITRKSQVSMLKMQKMAPELERLKKKFGDDTKAYQQAQMELTKEMGFTPVLGCLPLFLQMPVFINLYGALQSTFELRQAPFLRFGWLHLTWIRDLSEPDNLVKFASPVTIPFLGWHVYGINVLPVLMAVVTFMNQKFLMPPPAVQTAEQEQQRKMMVYTSLLFPLMFYAVPSGLNLYYLTSTGLGIIESWSIRNHIKKREAMEKAGKEFVDAGRPTRASRQKKLDAPEAEKKSGFGAWFANLQAQVEDMRRQGPPGKRKD